MKIVVQEMMIKHRVFSGYIFSDSPFFTSLTCPIFASPGYGPSIANSVRRGFNFRLIVRKKMVLGHTHRMYQGDKTLCLRSEMSLIKGRSPFRNPGKPSVLPDIRYFF